ncbi:MAG TPA: glycosyl hydrolase [Candidatus Sulfotelmatobacter sp.]|nr:glycosyl hydrolase [Candidatus Sulfotelmatobacter sp.]
MNAANRKCGWMMKLSLGSGIVLLSCAVLAFGQGNYKFDAATVSGLPARNIGSAAMSGRIAAIDAVEQDGRITVFVGSASGGVWKSVNGGTTYKSVFDRESVQSIGAVAIDPSNTKTVWVGSGEGWLRNSVSIGDGVYKSTDSGENWTNVGLKNSEHIAKILVDPTNGSNVLVCAMGHLWDDSDERGVYKTSDGGKTWNKVLAGANGSSGCALMAMSRQEPKTIYASMWDFRRQAWTFRSGGPGSGLFKSTDGGDHWSEISDSSAKGLPPKPWGRVAVAVAPAKPQVVYANIEAEKGRGLYRSDDGGANWTKLDASNFMVWRPFYFGNLIVDPKDENKIFKPDLILLYSTDGGKSFNVVSGSDHGDFHDVWINPKNPNIVIAGDDGGLWRSEDGGNRWKHQMNLPVSQFYHVSTDNSDPYHVYGGLQDNSSWVADSSYPGGVSNSRWENMFGGDGFWMFEDTSDPNFIYAEAQGGEIGRVNRYTHEIRGIKPLPNYGEKKLRFNWNTPIHVSPNEKGTIYIGAQFLFRSRDHGQTWDRISPDLTTNDPEKQKQEESGGVTVDNSSAEMNTTIYSISESPKNGQVIWVGTDDGNLQITRDGGKTWTNVVGNVSGLGKNSWVSTVEASHYDEATAYVTFDRHMFGDMAPYVYKTTDYGKTWTALAAQKSGARGFAHVIKEDTVNPNLLFLGTEFGLWISVDGGQHWAQYKGSNFPSVAVDDIAVHARESDLILATHGRGIWIIDDISPLRALTPDLMSKEATLIPGKAVQYFDTFGGWPEGDETFNGRSRPGEAQITYYQRGRHIFGDLKIEILDSNGKVVDSVAGSKHRGLNRANWSMRIKAPAVPPAASALFEAAQGPRVLPGTYTVKMTKGDNVYTEQLNVVLDPRAKFSLEDRKAQFDLAMKIYHTIEHMTFAVDAIEGVRNAANARAAKLPEKDPLRKQLQDLAAKCDDLRSKVVATKEGGMITGEERIRELLGQLYGTVNGYEGRPAEYQATREESLSHELEDVIGDFQKLTQKELPGINAGLKKKKAESITVLTEADWQKKREAEGSSGAAAGMMLFSAQRREMD